MHATASARKKLAEDGYHPTRGARPLRRLIEERVMTPIASKIAEDTAFRDRAIPILTAEDQAPAGFVVQV